MVLEEAPCDYIGEKTADSKVRPKSGQQNQSALAWSHLRNIFSWQWECYSDSYPVHEPKQYEQFHRGSCTWKQSWNCLENRIPLYENLTPELIRIWLQIGTKTHSTKYRCDKKGFLRRGDIPLNFKFWQEEGDDNRLTALSEE